MAQDIKELIAVTAERLILIRKKLTVSDIAQECNITRQAFYYHFQDIPDLFRWILSQRSQEVIDLCCSASAPEDAVRHFLLFASNAIPAIKAGLRSVYGDELDRIMTQQLEEILRRNAAEKGLFPDRSEYDRCMLLRYHTCALMGILRSWSDADTENIDRIAAVIASAMKEK